MIDRLIVRLFDRRIGEVIISGAVRSPEDWSFAYDADYLQEPDPVALSISLPLRPGIHSGSVVRNWFCNLLPEGSVRDAVIARLRIPERDDFALLAAIGGECAGAVSLHLPDAAPARGEKEETDLETLLFLQGDDGGEGTWALLGTPPRLSLAGAQDKIAVIAGQDGRLRLPRPDEASTHILKPDSRRFRGLRDLEALGLALARATGLDAVHALPVVAGNRPALLVERYDRIPDETQQTQRLHQEDFCQALGYPGELKYQSQGGPGLATCSQLIRRIGLGPSAIQGLLDWVVFNVLIGNADAHAKNLALLCDRSGRRRLAPFYDLVPTMVLSSRLVERTPALRVGAAQEIDNVARADWQEFARQTGYGTRFVLDRVDQLAERLLDSLPDVGAMLIEQGCDPARIQRAADVISANARFTRDRARGNAL